MDTHAPVIPGRTRSQRLLVALGTLAWSFACASPGLFGTWVYDDQRMVDNPVYDGWDDVAAVFSRTALDYLIAPDSTELVPRGSETYRPVTMLVLVATNVVAQSALLHHLVGWLLHVTLAGLLLLALRQTLLRAGEPVGATPWCLATVFLLHPVGVEAYVWINGRSDLMAGIFVMLAALVSLEATSPEPRFGRLRRPGTLCVAAFVSAGLAMGSKETALGALVAVWASALIYARQHPKPVRNPRLIGAAAFAAGAGVATYVIAWYLVQEGGLADPGEGGPILLDPDTRAFAPKLMAIAAGTLLSLEAAPMQSYVWLAFRDLAPIEWLGAVLGVAFIAYLVVRRDGRGLALLAGAVLTILPTVVLIRSSMWLGRDRYLYAPLLLLMLAIAPHLVIAVRRRSERLRWLPVVVFAIVVVGASASTAIASGYYESQVTWMTSGLRPETGDPTRYAFAADEMARNHKVDAARAFLVEMPPPPWPLLVSLSVLTTAAAIRDPILYERVLTNAEREHPDRPEPVLHRLHQQLRLRNVEVALRLLPAIASTEHCTEAARILRDAAAAATVTSEQRAAMLRARAGLPCIASRPR